MRNLGKKVLSWTLCLMMAVAMLPGMTRKAKATEASDVGIIQRDDGIYEISNYAGLVEFANIVNGTGAHAGNANSSACAIIPDGVNAIDASASATDNPWIPIGKDSNHEYTGIFDGNGKKIIMLTINDSSMDDAGLFGYVGNRGIVKNVGLEGGSVNGRNCVGGVVGSASYGIVENCYNTGKVSGIKDVGGVVGFASGGTVKNCYNSGTVNGSSDDVGGVVGNNPSYGKIINSYNIGNVSGKEVVGGVVGYAPSDTLENCYNTGDVKGSSEVGGVAGCKLDGPVSNCYNTGNVSGKEDVGGVVGITSSGAVENCYNIGNVSGTEKVGGVVGYNNRGTVENCYSTGDVEGSSKVGGVAGYNAFGTVENSYNIGNVTVTGNDVGGVVGHNVSGKVKNCYYDICTCQIGEPIGKGSGKIDNVTGLTTAQMTGIAAIGSDAMNFSENSPWLTKANDLSENGKYTCYYPHLKGFDWKNEKGERVSFPVNSDACTQMDADDISAAYWPAKIEISIQFEESPSYVYDGTSKYPTVKEIVFGNKILSAGSDYETVLSDKDCIDAGEYSLTISFPDTGYMKGFPSIEKKFTITKKGVTITARSKEFTYSGEAQSWNQYDVEGLVGDDEITATISGSITYPGEGQVTNKVTGHRFESGNSENYNVTTKDGTLTMKNAQEAITITAASQEWDYDGQVHENTEVAVTSGSLLAGDKLVASATGSVKNISDTKEGNNPVADGYKVMHGEEDVTANYVITTVAGTLTVKKPAAPSLTDDQKPAPKKDIKEDGKEQVLVLDPAKLPEGYTIEYSTDDGATWTTLPTGKKSGEYSIQVRYTGDENHSTFAGDAIKVLIQGVYNQTDSDGDWTKGSGKTYTFRIKKAFDDETCFENFTGLLVDGKAAQIGQDYTAAKGSTVITFAADYLETLSVGEHLIKVTFKDGETSVVLKVLAAPAADTTPTTGDTANPLLWAAMILLAVAFAAVIVWRRREHA